MVQTTTAKAGAPNGLPDIVLQIDRLEIGYKSQVIGITPSKDKDA